MSDTPRYTLTDAERNLAHVVGRGSIRWYTEADVERILADRAASVRAETGAAYMRTFVLMWTDRAASTVQDDKEPS